MERPQILLLTHGGWGMTLVECAKMIMGAIDCVSEVPLSPETTMSEYYAMVNEAAASLPKDSLIFTDIFGGTTTNVAARVGRDRGFKVLSGLNLPLLMEACTGIMNSGSYEFDAVLFAGKTAVKDVVEEITKALQKKQEGGV